MSSEGIPPPLLDDAAFFGVCGYVPSPMSFLVTGTTANGDAGLDGRASHPPQLSGPKIIEPIMLDFLARHSRAATPDRQG